jgi:hypothetical protein
VKVDPQLSELYVAQHVVYRHGYTENTRRHVFGAGDEDCPSNTSYTFATTLCGKRLVYDGVTRSDGDYGYSTVRTLSVWNPDAHWPEHCKICDRKLKRLEAKAR